MTRSNRLLSRSPLLWLLAASLLLTGWLSRPARQASATSATAALPNLQGAAAIEHLKQTGLYTSFQAAVTSIRYGVRAVAGRQDKRFEADNPAQQMRAGFTAEGVEVNSAARSGSAWRLGLKLRSAGYGNQQIRVGSGALTAKENRTEYERPLGNQHSALSTQHSALSEWYVNTPQGLEQGFTLRDRLAARFDREPLRLELEFGGDWQARLMADGQAIEFADRTGKSVLRYDKLVAWDALGRHLPARMELTTRGAALVVEDADALYPLTIDPLLTQIRKMTASDGAVNDRFGSSVSISGDTAVVGAPEDDIGANNDQGSAYIFVRNQGGADNWGEIKKLTASDGAAGDIFGSSVSISGDTVIVGADINGGLGQGAAYVFARNQGGANNWGQVKKLTASNASLGDRFGTSVGISNDTIVVGTLEGEQAYIFARNQGGADNWGEVKIMASSDGTPGDRFGSSVSISNDTVVVGASLDDVGANTDQGSAYVFARNQGGADNWGEVRKLVAADGAAGEIFGGSVAIHLDTIVAGASQATVGGNAIQGAAYLYQRNQGGANNWGQVKKLTASDGAEDNRFGNSVALTSETVVVGAFFNNNVRGAVYAYRRNQGSANNWGEVQKLVASDGADNEGFGVSVAISGETVLVGAHQATVGANATQGAAYTFMAQGGNWFQQAKPVAADGAVNDRFGSSVSISGDTAVVGAPQDDIGANNDQGSAYILVRNQGGADGWGQIKKLTASDGVANDIFGTSVSISGDTVIVGADINGGFGQGAAYVFARNQGGANNWGQVKKLTPSDSQANARFGGSVGISNDTIVIGAPFHQVGANTNQGQAYVFALNQGGIENWGEVKILVAGDGAMDDRFGSVAISNDTIVVGAYLDDVGANSDQGSAYVFARNQGGADNWGQVRKLVAADGAAGDQFGGAVAINFDTIVAGANPATVGGNAGQGAAYLFARNQGGADNWGQIKKLTASDGAANNRFGNSVALTSEAVVVGALFNNNSRGAAYTYRRNQGGANNWGEAQKLVATDGMNGDTFGVSLAISGETVLIGARQATVGGNATQGAAYIFPVNCPPAITPVGALARQQGSAGTVSTIATVSDVESAPGSIVVSVQSAPTGITVTGFTNTNGVVTATVTADCSAAIGANTVVLLASDPNGGTATANLSVSVTANTAPTLGVYSNTVVGFSGNTTVIPNATPADNVGVSSLSASAPGFTGSFSGDPATGIITVTNANPIGSYNVTATATDNCGATVVRNFTLTVTGAQSGGCATPGFDAATNFAAGSNPRGVATGDFNLDGRLDMAVANAASNSVSVFLGNGTGGFGAATNFATGVFPNGVAVADMNRDGRADLLTANNNGFVSVLLGDGAGGFGAATNFAVGSSPNGGLATGDFNLDGNTDVAATNAGSNNFSLLLGNGAGGLGTAANFTTGTLPIGLTASDFNQDGKPDVAVSNQSSDNVSVFLGNGAGSFSAATNFPVGISPVAVATGDFNLDGRPDLVTANFNPSTVSVLLGNGAGGFTAATNFAVGAQPRSVAVIDFNQDGKPDIAAANVSSNNVSFLLGNGAGGFVAATNFAVGTGPFGVAVGDFNLDGRPDLATANFSANNASVLLNICNGTPCGGTSFAGATNFAAGMQASGVAAGDFNLDGKPDLAVANSGSANVSVLLANGAGSFGAATNFAVGSNPRSVAVSDFNLDGKPDIATGNSGSNNISVLLGDGAGGFGAATNFAVGNSPQSVAVGDFNLDGKPDLAASNSSSSSVSVLLGNGAGSFGAATNFTVQTAPFSVAVGDFNLDGKPDFAAANYISNTVSVRLGNGAGSFGAATNFAVVTRPIFVAVGDFNQDGKPDLATANDASADVSVLLGNGAGSFGTATTFAVGANPRSIAVGDFNRDGRPDLAVANVTPSNVSMLLGNGAGSFGAATNFAVGTGLQSVAAGDFNLDGKSDLATANFSSNNASVLLSNCFSGAQTLTVNTTADTIAADGFCSLREAIQAANSNTAINECPSGAPGLDNITFNLGAGTPSIAVTSALPAITEPVNINGATGGATRVELNGAGAGAADGLIILAGNSTVSSLVINRFSANGINIGTTGGNLIQNCFIGTNAGGTAASANGSFGVLLRAPADNNTIGGVGNVISGNGRSGIELRGSSNNQLLGNFIGTNATGTVAIANAEDGVLVSNELAPATGNVIGGPAASARNFISGNTGVGIRIVGATTTNTQVLGNSIGTNAAGNAAIPNAGGVLTSDSPNNVIGGMAAGAGNVISGNTNEGVLIGGTVANLGTGNQVQGNFIGTAMNGLTALPNGTSGVFIGTSFNNIGGTTALARNIISGNAGNGVMISGATVTGNQVLGNSIGTDVNGAAGLGQLIGVSILGAVNNTIGGTATGAGNLISANTSTGISISGATATGNLVQGNLVGTNAAGTAALGNANGVGISNMAFANTIGGTATNARNIISGNTNLGVFLSVGATGNLVQGNFIGVNPAGSAALGNGNVGVLIDQAPANTIGGTTVAARNIISANDSNGVEISGNSAINNVVAGNFIGVNAAGTAALANTAAGVQLTNAPSNTIGGVAAGAGNLISGNSSAGVAVTGATATGNRMLGNSIALNGLSGIDLGADGITANDTGDGDTGANNLQNFPVLSSVTTSGGVTNLAGTLNSTPNTVFRIEFFANASCDASGNGEGQFLIGSTDVMTDGSGNATISASLPTSLLSLPVLINGGVVTATATDAAGNTSEFSPCQCNFAINPTEAGIAAAGSIGNAVTIVAPNGCNWTAVSNSPFITVTGGASGSGDGTVTYNVTANPGTQPRTGSLTIAGYTFYATQAANGTVLNEGFNGGIPPDWDVMDTGGAGGTGDGMTWVTANTPPCAQTPNPGPPFVPPYAVVDFSCAPPQMIPDESLITPPFDARGLDQVVLQFDSFYRFQPGDLNIIADVDISLDRELTWTNVLRLTQSEAANTRTVNVTPFIPPNSADVRVRFHFYATGPRPARPTAPRAQEISWGIDRPMLLALTVAAIADFPSNGDTQLVRVTAPNGYGWTPTEEPDVPWLTIVDNGNRPMGMGTGTFTVSTEPYGGICPRATTIRVTIPGTGPTPLLTVSKTVTQTGSGLSILPANPILPPISQGQPYSQTFSQTGSNGTITWSVSMGSLPPGLMLNPSTGELSGTPTTTGTFTFKIKGVDAAANNCVGEREYTLAVIMVGNGLQFYPLASPVRLLDTRASATAGCVINSGPFANNETRTLTARTVCSTIPANATAIIGNITVVPTGPGFLTLFPSIQEGGATQPTVANSNFKAGEVTNNFFTVGLGAGDGAFKIFTSLFNAGTTSEVIIDVTGYYAPPAPGGLYYHPLPAPVRLLQTFPGQTGCFLNGSQQLAGQNNPNANPALDLVVDGRGAGLPSPCNGIPADAVVLVGNATTVFPNAPLGFGYLTIYPSDATRPTVASSNYGNNDIINGPFAVKLGADGKFKVYTFSTTHLVIDISGYYSASANDANGVGLLFNPLPKPMRLLETRDIPNFTLTGCYQPKAPIPGGTGGIRTQQVWGTCSDQPVTIPNAARAVVGNVTVINPVNAGFGTFFPGNVGTAPTVATTNYPFPVVFGYNRHYYVGLSPTDGTYKILTQFTSDYIVDVSGYFAP